MGQIESSDPYEHMLPPPPRSTLFVVRNGRYEPQNLMPVLPRSDMLDFDGFVVRRGNGHGCMNARPPEMKQASLVKNPVSIRRDSCKVKGPGIKSPRRSRGNDADESTLSFVFDAQKAGDLKLLLMVHEIEKPLFPEEEAAEEIEKREESPKRQPKKGVPRTIELVPQELTDTQAGPVAVELDSRRFEPGLGQIYISPPVDFSIWHAERLAYDRKRPKDIPIAVRLETDQAPGEPVCIHYTYISLRAVGSAAQENSEPADGDPTVVDDDKWRPMHTYAQKLQYGAEPFVLHEVFGALSRASDADEGGNQDCVICLSEPRDTAVLPCRHMCFCSYCAGIVRLQCDRCPVCRQKVASLLQFKRNDTVAEGRGEGTNASTAAIGSVVAASAAAAAATSTLGSALVRRSSRAGSGVDADGRGTSSDRRHSTVSDDPFLLRASPDDSTGLSTNARGSDAT